MGGPPPSPGHHLNVVLLVLLLFLLYYLCRAVEHKYYFEIPYYAGLRLLESLMITYSFERDSNIDLKHICTKMERVSNLLSALEKEQAIVLHRRYLKTGADGVSGFIVTLFYFMISLRQRTCGFIFLNIFY